METKILTQKHWVIFIAFIAVVFASEVVVEFIAHIFNLGWIDRPRQLVEFLFTIPVYFWYPFLVVRALNHKLEGCTKFERPMTRHLILMIGFFVGAQILRLIAIDPESVFDYLLWSIAVICWLILFSVPAKQLKSIELKRNAGIWEFVSETFQFVFWPLGLWWIQPRLNKMAPKEVTIVE